MAGDHWTRTHIRQGIRGVKMASKEQIQTRINLADVQHEERKDNVQETLAFLRNDFSDVHESDHSDAVTLAPNFMASDA
jgi:Holliday junction resolvasome RuvABC endonuclease subunit